MHFFLSYPERYPIRDISISNEKLKGLLTEFLYDGEKIKSLQDAQREYFQRGEQNIYEDLIDSLEA